MNLSCTACAAPLPYVDGWWLHPEPEPGQAPCLGKPVSWDTGHWVVPDLNFAVHDIALTAEQRDLLLVAADNHLSFSMITAVKLVLADALESQRAEIAEDRAFFTAIAEDEESLVLERALDRRGRRERVACCTCATAAPMPYDPGCPVHFG